VSPTINPSQPKNQRAHLVTAVPGPKSQELRRREDAHMAPGLQGYAVMWIVGTSATLLHLRKTPITNLL
jgi:hypothetical protein